MSAEEQEGPTPLAPSSQPLSHCGAPASPALASLWRPSWQARTGHDSCPAAAPPLPGLLPVHLMPTAVSVIEKPTGHTRATSWQPPWLQARSQPYSPQGPWASETGGTQVSTRHAQVPAAPAPPGLLLPEFCWEGAPRGKQA